MTLKRTSTFFSALFIIAALLLAPSPAKAQLGVNGGLNFSSVDDIDATDRSATLENSTGYHLGVVYNLGMGPVAFRPAVVYRQIGEYQFDLPGQESKYKVSAWEVPLDVKLSFSIPVISPYIMVGPMATFPRGDGELDDAMEDISYTLNAGLGGSLSLGSVTFEPELRYEFGATEYFEDDFEIAGAEFTPEDSPRFSAYSLRLNILF